MVWGLCVADVVEQNVDDISISVDVMGISVDGMKSVCCGCC